MGDGQTRRDAAAGGAAVDLGLAEPAEVIRDLARGQALAVGQDGAVEEGQVGLLGVPEAARRAQFGHQLAGGVDQPVEGRLMKVEPQPAAWQDRVEGAAIADVELDSADALQLYAVVQGEGEGLDALEAHHGRGGGIAVREDLDGDRAAGAFQGEAGLGAALQARLVIEKATQGDGGVAAHRRIARVVGEQDGGVAGRVARRHQDRPIHVGMAARLQHHGAAQMVEPVAHGAAFLKDRLAGEVERGRIEDAHRLARRVHVDNGQAVRVQPQLVHPDHALAPTQDVVRSDIVYYISVQSILVRDPRRRWESAAGRQSELFWRG
ncbi:hypothetical protein D3C73_601340 [compost metagenome]